jgi:hypothetical protein
VIVGIVGDLLQVAASVWPQGGGDEQGQNMGGPQRSNSVEPLIVRRRIPLPREILTTIDTWTTSLST